MTVGELEEKIYDFFELLYDGYVLSSIADGFRTDKSFKSIIAKHESMDRSPIIDETEKVNVAEKMNELVVGMAEGYEQFHPTKRDGTELKWFKPGYNGKYTNPACS